MSIKQATWYSMMLLLYWNPGLKWYLSSLQTILQIIVKCYEILLNAEQSHLKSDDKTQMVQ